MHARPLIPALLLPLAFALASCGLLGTDAPTKAELRLDGQAGTQVSLLYSTNFLSQQQAVFEDGIYVKDTLIVQLLSSQTATVALPFSQTYDISGRHQYYVRILRHAPDTDGLQAQLLIDGEMRSEQTPHASLDSLTLLYNFVGRPIEPPPVEV